MHEQGLAQEICTTVQEESAGRKVKKILIEAGRFSGANPGSLSFWADSISRDMGLGDDIEITINEVAGKAACACGKEYQITDLLKPCPFCGGFDREVIEGGDVTIVSIEVEKDDEQ